MHASAYISIRARTSAYAHEYLLSLPQRYRQASEASASASVTAGASTPATAGQPMRREGDETGGRSLAERPLQPMPSGMFARRYSPDTHSREQPLTSFHFDSVSAALRTPQRHVVRVRVRVRVVRSAQHFERPSGNGVCTRAMASAPVPYTCQLPRPSTTARRPPLTCQLILPTPPPLPVDTTHPTSPASRILASPPTVAYY